MWRVGVEALTLVLVATLVLVITFSPATLPQAQHQSHRFSLTKLLPQKLITTQRGRGMLVAIDANVEHGDALAAGAIKGAKLVMLNAKEASIEQITRAIRQTETSSVHIVTHGSPGCLHFSSGDLTIENLHHYAEQLESWFHYRPFHRRSKMRVQGHENFLSLYSCNVAKGEVGQSFLERLHYLVGVSIHASQRKVGSIALNGSWNLDIAYPFPHQSEFPFTEDLLETYDAVL